MRRTVRISDEKHARWNEIEHQIMDNHHRLLEQRDRVQRALRRPERCPHCGERLDAPAQRKRVT